MSKTVAQILDEVKDALELRNSEAYGERSLDPMVSDSYLIQKVNDSLEEIQAEIMACYEDYFLTYYTMQLVSGQQEYDMPSNIAINKIRRVICHKGANHLDPDTISDVYKVNRLLSLDSVYALGSSDDYRYMLIDRPATGDPTSYSTKFVIFPKARTSSEYITYWFIRELASVSTTGDTVDVPFMRFLVEDVKAKVLEKDVGNPMTPLILDKRERLKELMLKTVSNKVPDDMAGYMMQDNSHYDDSVL